MSQAAARMATLAHYYFSLARYMSALDELASSAVVDSNCKAHLNIHTRQNELARLGLTKSI
jgi:hypothetical protein